MYSKHFNDWTTDSLDIHYLKEPFHIQELPFGSDVYVIDDYLDTTLHRAIDAFMIQCAWQKSNQVLNTMDDNRGGLPNHSLWGACFFNGHDQTDGYLHGKNGFPVHIIRWLDRKLQTDFGFNWVRFQYAGGNSQTMGQHGTCHSDCQDVDEWNISFLYYTNTFWNPNWGGDLRFYDTNGAGGAQDNMDDYEIGRVAFKPNRLLMFDGRVQHGAEAPSDKAQYIDRKSIVIRGDEVQLLDKEARYANH